MLDAIPRLNGSLPSSAIGGGIAPSCCPEPSLGVATPLESVGLRESSAPLADILASRGISAAFPIVASGVGASSGVNGANPDA